MGTMCFRRTAMGGHGFVCLENLDFDFDIRRIGRATHWEAALVTELFSWADSNTLGSMRNTAGVKSAKGTFSAIFDLFFPEAVRIQDGASVNLQLWMDPLVPPIQCLATLEQVEYDVDIETDKIVQIIASWQSDGPVRGPYQIFPWEQDKGNITVPQDQWSPTALNFVPNNIGKVLFPANPNAAVADQQPAAEPPVDEPPGGILEW